MPLRDFKEKLDGRERRGGEERGGEGRGGERRERRSVVGYSWWRNHLADKRQKIDLDVTSKIYLNISKIQSSATSSSYPLLTSKPRPLSALILFFFPF